MSAEIEYKTEEEIDEIEETDSVYSSNNTDTLEDESPECTSIFDIISEDDLCNAEENIKEYIDECMKQMMLQMSSPYFYESLVQEISQNVLDEWIAAGLCKSQFEEHHYDEIVEMVDRLCVAHFEMSNIPLRQEPTVDTVVSVNTPEEILSKLARIQSAEQAKQRTVEWYESRYNLLTASNLWKVFGSPAQYNSLIYEKCKPLVIHDRQNSSICVDSNSTLQHGIRYEPLSILLYERLYGTKVCDVGCIPHSEYSYIGASPDGIIMDPACPRYGRMIEVKNIVNRDITGVPLDSYWIQMQLQMEVCDLDECDFIETRFIPFENIESFCQYLTMKQTNDTELEPEPDAVVDNQFTYETPNVVSSGIAQFTYETPDVVSSGIAQTGLILYLYPRTMIGDTVTDVSPEYMYLPLGVDPLSEDAAEWIKTQCAEHPRHVLYKKTYWVLDQFSCVLVRRNREWFREALPKIEEAWNTILVERKTGYEHRATNPANTPNKKKKIQTEVVCSDTTTTHYIRNMPLSNTICLVKLGGGGTDGSP